MMSCCKALITSSVLLFIFFFKPCAGQLVAGFYSRKCNNIPNNGYYDGTVESVVQREVERQFLKESGVAAGFLRLHFHDCFVRGCDGSVLLDSSSRTEEKYAPPNLSLRGFEIVDAIKAKLEHFCPRVVSCADILAIAAASSVALAKGPKIQVLTGRRDGNVSNANDTQGNLPSPSSHFTTLAQAFAQKGFTQDEMVTLSGAHGIGRSHCSTISNRLYPIPDTTLNSSSLPVLTTACPANANSTATLSMNPYPNATNTLGSQYYDLVRQGKALFTSDAALLENSQTRQQVDDNARDPRQWAANFARAMLKMGNMGVLTGAQGEIRADCKKVG